MNFKKVLALVLVVAMCLSMIPTYAFADDVDLLDEEQVAAQNDAPLEDEYIDEDPVEQDPVQEEPAATDPEEPAAEEPAAQEPAAEEPAAEEPAADTVEGLGSGETLSYNQISPTDVARINGTGYPSLAAAVAAASDGAYIELRLEDNVDVTINKAVTVEATEATAKLTGDVTISGVTVNFINMKAKTVYVQNGVLSIAENDNGVYDTVKATTAITSADVKGGTFTKISTVLLADGYGPSVNLTTGEYEISGENVSGTIGKMTVVATLTHGSTTRYFNSVRSAVTEAEAGDTVKLLADDRVSFTEAEPELGINKTLTIDGDNHTIYGVDKKFDDLGLDHDIFISGSSTVTIQNVTLDGFGASYQNYHTYPIWVGQSYTGKLTLNNVTIKNFSRTAVNIGGGSFEITNCTFTGNGPAADRFQSGVEVLNASGTITGTTMTGMGSKMTQWPIASCVQLGHPVSDSTGSVTLDTGNNFTGDYVAIAVSSDTASTTGTLSIKDGTYNGLVYHEGNNGGKVAVSGGTFDEPVPEDCCAEGFIPVKSDDGTYGVKTGEYVVRVTKAGKKPETGVGYVAADIADAIAVAATNTDLIMFVVKGEQTGVIPDGQAINVYPLDNCAFTPTAGENPDYYLVLSKEFPGNKINRRGSVTVTSTIHRAVITKDGAEPKYFKQSDTYASAIEDALMNGGTLKLLDKSVGYNGWTAANADKTITVDNSGTYKLSIGTIPTGYFLSTEGEDTVVFSLKEKVASYVKNGAEVFTESFKEAVEEAFEIAGTSGTPEVKLYKQPDIETAQDFYAMSAVGTLTVVATGSDLIDKLEAVGGYANSPFYKDMVTNNGAFVIEAVHNTGDQDFTYTATVAKASIVTGVDGALPIYFTTFGGAIENYVEHKDVYGTDAVIHALSSTDASYVIPSTQAATYTDLPLKVAADGDFDVSITYTNVGDEHLTVSENEAIGYTVYTLVPAVASYVDNNSNPVYTTTFAKAAEEDDEVTLYQVPVISGTDKDIHTMTAAGTLKVLVNENTVSGVLIAGETYKQLVTIDGELVINATYAEDNSGVTTFTYTVSEPVAKVKLNQDDPPYEYFDNLNVAFDTVFYQRNNENLYLIPMKSDTFVVTAQNLATYTNVAVRIDNSDSSKVIQLQDYKDTSVDPAVWYAWSKVDGENYSTYTLNKAVASIPMTTELDKYFEPISGEYVKYFGTFREAVIPATENDYAVTLLDTYEIPGSNPVATYTEIYKLESNGINSVKVKTNDKDWLTITTDEQKHILADEDPADATVTIYSLSDETPVASITYNGETTYYDSFATAKANGIADNAADAKTITLLAPVEGEFELARDKYMKVALNGNGDNFSVVPVANPDVPYRINKVTADGVTTYSPVLAAASIGTGADIKYYDTFAEAAKAAAGTETITLYKNAEYELGAANNVDQVVVFANGFTFSATSGVANKAAHKDTGTEGGNVIVTWSLVPAVASVDFSTDTETDIRYYETFDAAVKATAVATQTDIGDLKTIVLLTDVTTPYVLGFVDSQPAMIMVNNNGNQFAGVRCTVAPYAVSESTRGTATLYMEVEAVASVVTSTGTEYYATLSGEKGAIQAAFAAEGTEPTATVNLLNTPQAADKYSAEDYGSVLVDFSELQPQPTDEEAVYAINHFVQPADGIYVGAKKLEQTVQTPQTFLVSFHPAVASVQKNNGTYEYFGTLDEAFAVSNAQHPVILLANNMTYALATDTNISPIYVNKNGNEFTVTKVNPKSADPAVAIEFEELDDGITMYTATMETVAYVNFAKVVPVGDYGSGIENNYVYYTSFNDAVEDTNNSEYAIVLTRDMTAQEQYVMNDVNEVLRVATDTNIAEIAPDAGFELITTPVEANPAKGIPAHTYDYTVTSIVASVGTTPYHDLSLAIADAVENYEDPAILTMYQDAPADFTYPLNRLDKFLLAVNVFSESLEGKNFTAPEGYYVTTTEKTVGTVDVLEFFAKPAVAAVIDDDGEHVYATFTDAVDRVIEIENEKNYNDESKDPANPETVITLLANNPDEFQFGSAGYEGLKSLVINTGDFDPNLKPSSDANFVEKVTGEDLSVAQYRDVKIVATINFSPAWAKEGDPEYDVRKYSSFADAATAATEATATLKSEFTVVMAATPTTLPNSEENDVYKMSIGTLIVDATAISKDLREFINSTIVPVGENVVLSFTEKTAGDFTAGTFSVDGSEAMIVHPGVTVPKYFKTFQDALRYQDGNKNLVITPLTNINVHYTATPTDVQGSRLITTFYVDETVNYEVKVTVDRHETVRSETETGRYDFVPAKFAIQSDDPIGYDQRTWEPIYGYEYFADLSGASEAAQNTKVIIAIVDPTTYELGKNNANEVLNIKFTTDTAMNSFNPTSGQTGYGVDRADGTEARVYTYSLVALKTITVNPGDGAWTGSPEEAIPGASIATWTNTLKQNPPTKDGYHVDYYNGSDGNRYATGTDISSYNALPTEMPANGLTLTAHYAPNQYWVVYKADGQTDNWVKSTFGELITQPADPEKTGSKFEGWFLSNSQTAFDFANTRFTADLISDINVPATSAHGTDDEGKMILTAQFTLNQYTVSFDAQVDGVEIPSATVSHGYGVALPEFPAGTTTWSRTGYYDFTPSTDPWGYYDEEEVWHPWTFGTNPGEHGTNTGTSVYNDVTLVPKWESKMVTIVWADGSTVLTTTGPFAVGTPTDAYTGYDSQTKDGYRIDPDNAWVDDEGNPFENIVPATDSSQFIYYLNWIKQIPVSFMYDGEVLETLSIDENMPLSAYENLPRPEDETKVYTWTLKGEPYDLTTPVTQKMTLVGAIEDAPVVDEFNVTFRTVHGVAPDAQKVEGGEKAEKPEDPVEEGYTFTGWFLNDEEFDFNTPITEDIELIAGWEVVPTVTLQRKLALRDKVILTPAVGAIAEGTEASDYSVVATFLGEEVANTTLDTLSTATIDGAVYYLLPSVPVTSVQFAQPVDIAVSYKGEEFATLTTSVQEYCEYKYNDETAEETLRNVCQALVDFGAYTQLYFNKDTDKLPNENIGAGADVIAAAVIPDDFKAVGDRMQSLDLATAFSSKVAINSGKKASASALKDFQLFVNGREVETSDIGMTGKYYYTTVSGLRSIDLGTTYNFKLHQISTGTDTEVSCSALSWAYDYQNDEARGMMAKSLYLYFMAADANF